MSTVKTNNLVNLAGTGAPTLNGAPAHRSATFVVVANDAAAASKALADYVCDGTADDVQIQAAIDALPSGGGRVVLSEGTFSLTAAIDVLKQNVSIEGQGHSTVIQAALGKEDIDLIRLGDGGATTYGNLRLANLKISASAQKTADCGIKINKCFKVWLDNLATEKQYRTLHILNSTQVFITNCAFRNQKENGITIESDAGAGFDWYIVGLVMDNPDVVGGNTGIGIEWLGGETLHVAGADVMRFGTGMLINPGAGRECRWGFIEGLILDTCSDNGLKITNTGSGNVVGINFLNCWTSTNTNYGVLIEQPGAGQVQGLNFIGHKAMNNGIAGIRVTGGTDFRIADSEIVSNSAAAFNTRHGIEIAGDVSSWSIRGCRCTNGYGHGASQGIGISIDGGATDYYIIEGNDLRGNANTGLNNGAAAAVNKVVANNLT